MTYEGPPVPVWVRAMPSPAATKWARGCNTITQSVPNKLVRFKLEFQKPMVATNTVEFTFDSDDHQTTVTWGMSGVNNKMFGLFMNCEKMCAKQFDQGLAEMKSVVEAPGKTAARA